MQKFIVARSPVRAPLRSASRDESGSAGLRGSWHFPWGKSVRVQLSPLQLSPPPSTLERAPTPHSGNPSGFVQQASRLSFAVRHSGHDLGSPAVRAGHV